MVMAATTLADADDPTYTHFAHKDAFFELLSTFLAVDVSRAPGRVEDEVEEELVKELGAILDYYLPLPGLLDPHIDQIIPPLMEQLAKQVMALARDEDLPNLVRLNRLGRVINWIVKVRGWKAVVQHFPSTISYLPHLITVLSPPTSACSSSTPLTAQHPLIAHPDAWETRAVLLLWLALLLTVPFSLSALTSPQPVSLSQYSIDIPAGNLLFAVPTSDLTQRVILLSLPLLQRSGKEGAYAALVLARVFSRTDAAQGLEGFLDWAGAELSEGDREGEANLVASILELLALLPSMLPLGHLDTLERFMGQILLPHLRGTRTAAGSGLIRKLIVKARGRWWLTRLGQMQGAKDESEIPEGLEEQLDDLMTGLADKDTIVRYSSAKYIARLTAVLPEDFGSQIVLAVIGLFQGTEEEPVVETPFGTILDPGGSGGGDGSNKGESRWHGVCLAAAEMARRGLIKGDAVGEAVQWVMKALSFDIRRATHSVGSNVRDAASYVLWSLSRACPPETLSPYAGDMATGMMCAACFDREVGVRRAASAAFQEGVGRLGLYPEGIDVLAKSDFYSVSVRRIAFTIAAPAIAVHEIYRREMREHLHHITLRHWDEAMRTSASVALRDLLGLGDQADLDDAIDREIKHAPSLDANNVHGALSALTQIADLLPGSNERKSKIFFSLGTIRPAALLYPGSGAIIKQACEVICATLTLDILLDDASQRILDQFVEAGMKRREAEVQEAIADVFQRVSGLRDASKDAAKLVIDLKATRAVQRQAAALSLGHIQYSRCHGSLNKVVTALLAQLEEGTKADVETRRYAIRSLGDIALQTDSDERMLLEKDQLSLAILALIHAMSDYSTDQRGDVGSWIRVAAVISLGNITADFATRPHEDAVPPFSQDIFNNFISGLVKLLVEKLEPVRAAAARSWGVMRSAGVGHLWTWPEETLLEVSLAEPYEESFRYIDQKEWFARTMPLLRTKCRGDIMAGLVLCIGSQILSVSAMALEPFISYLSPNPEKGTEELVGDVIKVIAGIMAENIGSNRVFIPCLTTVAKLFRSNLSIDGEDKTKSISRIINLAVRGIDKMKSIDRISASMALVISALRLREPTTRSLAGGHLGVFLKHKFPRIRSMCAEQLYLALSDAQDEVNAEMEEVLLGTVWTDDEGNAAADQVVMLLQKELGV